MEAKTDGIQPTVRFTHRVDDYVKARPHYPPELAAFLREHCGLVSDSVVLDVGCGTGLLAEPFCKFGCRVLGVEPNAAMRDAGARYLERFRNFQMLAGLAESLPVQDASIDVATAGQAFHWFDVDAARREFRRVLQPDGWVVLVWNDRLSTGSKFAEDYEQLLARFGTDYSQVHHRGKANDENFRKFFGNDRYQRVAFPNAQRLDYEHLVARVLSSSYMPQAGHPAHGPMIEELRRIFRDNAQDSHVTIHYETFAIFGRP